MATLLSSIESQARLYMLETTAKFWSSAELIDIIIKGTYDLWGAIIDLHQEHHLTIDITNVSVAANATSLSGVPADTFRVHIIEPRDTTQTSSPRSVMFVPRDYNSDEFINARSVDAQDPSGQLFIYYALTGAGSPIAAPTVQVAPKLTTAVNLRFAYVPGLGAMTSASTNPIAGESDHALIAWCVAYARAKEREDRSPDPNWLAVYATEKQNLLTRLTPRQSQEPEVVADFFGGYW